MTKRRIRVQDDSVTRPGPDNPEEAGKSKRPHGESERKADAEPGRRDAGGEGPTNRPTGKSTARDTTSIDPQDPIDPRSPNLR
jgi:hypothetical protein